MYHERNNDRLSFARKLRKEMTKEERKLWYQFLRTFPIRFRRQEIIGDYIVDFYCASARLAIELDGSQHYEDENVIKDQLRTESIQEESITVLRIPNNAVTQNFEGVCTYIEEAVNAGLREKPLSHAARNSSPVRGAEEKPPLTGEVPQCRNTGAEGFQRRNEEKLLSHPPRGGSASDSSPVRGAEEKPPLTGEVPQCRNTGGRRGFSVGTKKTPQSSASRGIGV